MLRKFDCYKRLCTEFYDLDKPAAPPDALEFYWRRYEATGGPALEVMCGSGRFLVPFAQRGADIDGVDASVEMLEACRRKIAGLGLTASLYLQSIQELDLRREYRFVFVPAGSFVLIPLDEQAVALQRIAAHIVPRGELVIEMITPVRAGGGQQPERRVQRRDGSQIVLNVDGDGTYRYELVHDGTVIETERERYDRGPRGRVEFAAMLEGAGFEGVQPLVPYSSDTASDSESTIVYVCRRT